MRREATLYESKCLRRVSNVFHTPAVALSVGWIGDGYAVLGMVVVTLSAIVVLLGRLAHTVSETTSARRPWGRRSRHDDPASSYTLRSNSANRCRGLASSV